MFGEVMLLLRISWPEIAFLGLACVVCSLSLIKPSHMAPCMIQSPYATCRDSDCQGFANPHRFLVWVNQVQGTGAIFLTQEEPIPMDGWLWVFNNFLH
jgi:hypothetical protein